MTFRIKKTP